ncbi:MAG: class I SAM-dependent methyltransferase [bacterium]
MTVAENLRRSGSESRAFDLPKKQEMHLRALVWKDIRAFNGRLGPARQFLALDFRHFMEFTEALLTCSPKPGQKVLEAGGLLSPIGLYLASKGCEVTLVDLDPQVMKQEQFARDAGLGALISKKKFMVRKADARTLDYPDGHFDIVLALSCVDYTRDDADKELMTELARVLAPGGTLAVSVHVGPKYRQTQEGKYPLRFYDDTHLESRIIAPSSLALLRKFYFGDDTAGLGALWYRLPDFIRQWMLGWIVYPVAQAVAASDVSTKRDATAVCLTFQKVAVSGNTPVGTPSTSIPATDK